MEGYNSNIENKRDEEFPGLTGLTYLDHAGTTIYARSQLALFNQDLMSNVYGNPHSPCASSRLTADTIEQVRYRILQHFNTSSERHSVIFTAGCTAALKLLADNFDWAYQNPNSQLEPNIKQSTKIYEDLRKQELIDQAKPSEIGASANVVTPQTIQQCHSNYANQQDHSQHEMPKGAGIFCYLSDNHTSVVGMREIARAKGADVLCVAFDDIQQGTGIQCRSAVGNCLFAFPAQSNFSGTKYPLDLVKSVQHLMSSSSQSDRWAVVLDAASLVSTSPLDLSECEADFVAMSFYKMFGFPTGLGALIVRNDAARFLHKTYFGGGTMQAYLASRLFSVSKPSLSDKFEDGTLPFLDIIALKHGFDTLERLAGTMTSISEHTFSLAKYVHHSLASYRHANGCPVARLFCDNDFESKELQGPIVNFLLLRSSGEVIGYTQIEKLASLHGVHLRTGCFCNTGACQSHLGLEDQQIIDNFQAGHVCGDEMDLIGGQPSGSVRISFGYMSTLADADNFLSFVQDCFIEKLSCSGPAGESVVTSPAEVSCLAPRSISLKAKNTPSDNMCVYASLTSSPATELQEAGQTIPRPDISVPTTEEITSSSGDRNVLTNIFLYPVKSCGAFEVKEWEIGPKGLLYDRHWMVVTDSGVCLSQKRAEHLCLIKPVIDLKNRCLWLQYQGQDAISVPLDVSCESNQDYVDKNKMETQSRVCLDRVRTLDCGDPVANWLSAALGRQCRLLQQNPAFDRNCRLAKGVSDDKSGSRQQSLSLVNESPFTLLSRASAQALMNSIRDRNHSTANQPIRDGSHIASDHPQPITGQHLLNGNKEAESDDVCIEELIARFRGNFVIDGGMAFDEDDWKKIQIGNHVFPVAGVCARCQMVCIDQTTAKRSKEPLLSLSLFRGKKVPFGIHLLGDKRASSSEGVSVCVGDRMLILQ